MIYLDSNIFVYARIDTKKQGETARKILGLLTDFEAVTSVLTIDEIIWAVKKELKSYKKAIRFGEQIIKLPLKIVSARAEDLLRAFTIMKKGIKPRDAIHAATALNHGASAIITEDIDFKRVKGIKMLTFSEFLKEMNNRQS